MLCTMLLLNGRLTQPLPEPQEEVRIEKYTEPMQSFSDDNVRIKILSVKQSGKNLNIEFSLINKKMQPVFVEYEIVVKLSSRLYPIIPGSATLEAQETRTLLFAGNIQEIDDIYNTINLFTLVTVDIISSELK
ncbi:hypothetical protein LJC55_02765 [Eubacteriales bacterium OttesenSCG-928-N14]|nr:hypothetical protein [Eubacteriales bacterium OttesenSCG-928-N14]